jgi:hypothetical protein
LRGDHSTDATSVAHRRGQALMASNTCDSPDHLAGNIVDAVMTLLMHPDVCV